MSPVAQPFISQNCQYNFELLGGLIINAGEFLSLETNSNILANINYLDLYAGSILTRYVSFGKALKCAIFIFPCHTMWMIPTVQDYCEVNINKKMLDEEQIPDFCFCC